MKATYRYDSYRIWIGTVLLVAVCLILPGLLLAAPADPFYQDGKRAVEEGRWETAASLLTRAIEVEPHEKNPPFSGPFIPRYFLGLSLFELGDCELALQHLRSSRHYGVVVDTKYLPRLEYMEKRCEERARRVDGLRREIRSAERQVAEVEKAADNPALRDFWSRGLPPPEVEFREAQLALGRALLLLDSRRTIGSADGPRLSIRPLGEAQLADAESIVTQVVSLLDSLQQQTERQVEQTASSREDLLNEILRLRLQLVRLWGARSSSIAAGRNGDDVRAEYQRLTRMQPRDPAVTYDELLATRDELESLLARLETLPRRSEPAAPRELRLAAEAYFDGNYEQVLAVLEGVSFRQRRAQAHLHLFRAAASYALYLIGQPPDPALLQIARAEAEQCREAGPGVEPLADAFSPRFIEFFQQQAMAKVEEVRPTQDLSVRPGAR